MIFSFPGDTMCSRSAPCPDHRFNWYIWYCHYCWYYWQYWNDRYNWYHGTKVLPMLMLLLVPLVLLVLLVLLILLQGRKAPLLAVPQVVRLSHLDPIKGWASCMLLPSVINKFTSSGGGVPSTWMDRRMRSASMLIIRLMWSRKWTKWYCFALKRASIFFLVIRTDFNVWTNHFLERCLRHPCPVYPALIQPWYGEASCKLYGIWVAVRKSVAM